MFGTIEAAIDYIKSKLSDFYGRGLEMENLYQMARANVQDAFAQNKLISEAQTALAEAIDQLNEYYELQQKLKPLADAFDVPSGLGFLPALPVAVYTAIEILGGVSAVITIAGLLYNWYLNLEVKRAQIQAVKDGLMPASDLGKRTPGMIDSLGSLAGSLTGLLLVGGALFFLYKGKII